MDFEEKNVKISKDICIIGAGVVGMFLASRCAESSMSSIIIERNCYCGGQMNLYNNKTIYNLPLVGELKGIDVILKIKQELSHANDCDIIFNASVIDLQKTKDGRFLLKIKKKDFSIKTIECKYLVLATGKGYLEPNKLAIDGLEKIENKVLFYNVDCKENFSNKNVVIAGGGDSVIDWSCELSEISNKITVIHRREINRPENPRFCLFKSLCEKNRICLKTQFNIVDFLFIDDNFSGVKISNGKIFDQIYCDNVLVFFGLKSTRDKLDIYTDLGIQFDSKGALVSMSNNETNCENIFAIGDCCSYTGKIDNIFMGFSDAMKCYYEICHREQCKIVHKHD